MNTYQREIDCLKRSIVAMFIAKDTINNHDHTEDFMEGWEAAHELIMTSLLHVVDELERLGKEDEEDPGGRA